MIHFKEAQGLFVLIRETVLNDGNPTDGNDQRTADQSRKEHDFDRAHYPDNQSVRQFRDLSIPVLFVTPQRSVIPLEHPPACYDTRSSQRFRCLIFQETRKRAARHGRCRLAAPGELQEKSPPDRDAFQ
jgi:hypothetical protein